MWKEEKFEKKIKLTQDKISFQDEKVLEATQIQINTDLSSLLNLKAHYNQNVIFILLEIVIFNQRKQSNETNKNFSSSLLDIYKEQLKYDELFLLLIIMKCID